RDQITRAGKDWPPRSTTPTAPPGTWCRPRTAGTAPAADPTRAEGCPRRPVSPPGRTAPHRRSRPARRHTGTPGPSWRASWTTGRRPLPVLDRPSPPHPGPSPVGRSYAGRAGQTGGHVGDVGEQPDRLLI